MSSEDPVLLLKRDDRLKEELGSHSNVRETSFLLTGMFTVRSGSDSVAERCFHKHTPSNTASGGIVVNNEACMFR